jgi:hypothetical protein
MLLLNRGVADIRAELTLLALPVPATPFAAALLPLALLSDLIKLLTGLIQLPQLQLPLPPLLLSLIAVVPAGVLMLCFTCGAIDSAATGCCA